MGCERDGAKEAGGQAGGFGERVGRGEAPARLNAAAVVSVRLRAGQRIGIRATGRGQIVYTAVDTRRPWIH